jgi:hypothetical protein
MQVLKLAGEVYELQGWEPPPRRSASAASPKTARPKTARPTNVSPTNEGDGARKPRTAGEAAAVRQRAKKR